MKMTVLAQASNILKVADHLLDHIVPQEDASAACCICL
jgi:hypothetical protein